MHVPFESDGATGVGKIDRLLFGRDLDLWIAIRHDYRYYLGGPPSEFFAANAEFYSLIKRYSPMPLRRFHRWLGVTVGAWGWVPMPKARWGWGWEYPQTSGDVTSGKFTIETERPKAIKLMWEAGSSVELMTECWGNLIQPDPSGDLIQAC